MKICSSACKRDSKETFLPQGLPITRIPVQKKCPIVSMDEMPNSVNPLIKVKWLIFSYCIVLIPAIKDLITKSIHDRQKLLTFDSNHFAYKRIKYCAFSKASCYCTQSKRKDNKDNTVVQVYFTTSPFCSPL